MTVFKQPCSACTAISNMIFKHTGQRFPVEVQVAHYIYIQRNLRESVVASAQVLALVRSSAFGSRGRSSKGRIDRPRPSPSPKWAHELRRSPPSVVLQVGLLIFLLAIRRVRMRRASRISHEIASHPGLANPVDLEPSAQRLHARPPEEFNCTSSISPSLSLSLHGILSSFPALLLSTTEEKQCVLVQDRRQLFSYWSTSCLAESAPRFVEHDDSTWRQFTSGVTFFRTPSVPSGAPPPRLENRV